MSFLEKIIPHLAWPVAALIGLWMLKPVLLAVVDQIKELAGTIRDLKEIKFVEISNDIEKFGEQITILIEKIKNMQATMRIIEEQSQNNAMTLKSMKEQSDLNAAVTSEIDIDTVSPKEEVFEKKSGAVEEEWKLLTDKFFQEFRNHDVFIDRRAIGSTAMFYADGRRALRIDRKCAEEIADLHTSIKSYRRLKSTQNPIPKSEENVIVKRIRSIIPVFHVIKS